MKVRSLKIEPEKLIAVFAIVIWVFLLLSTINKSYSFLVRNDKEVVMAYLLFNALLVWGVVALFAPFFIGLAKRFPLEGPSYRNISLHILFSMLFVPLHAFIHRALMTVYYADLFWEWDSFISAVPLTIISVGIIDPLSYWLIIGAFYFKKYYDEYRERQLRNSEMEAELASARLHVLKVQLHPHFLFNTLHNVNSLIHENPDTAKSVLDLLKRFLQRSISKVNDQLVALEDELSFTGTYLEIEKTRFADRLTIQKNIDEETLSAQVPSFLLQPLVENAVRHGISKNMEPGVLKITSVQKNGRLVLTVEDNGPGLNGTIKSNGVGLENIKQRLDQLYDNAKLELKPSSLGGLKVNIEIPYKVSENLVT